MEQQQRGQQQQKEEKEDEEWKSVNIPKGGSGAAGGQDDTPKRTSPRLGDSSEEPLNPDPPHGGAREIRMQQKDADITLQNRLARGIAASVCDDPRITLLFDLNGESCSGMRTEDEALVSIAPTPQILEIRRVNLLRLISSSGVLFIDKKDCRMRNGIEALKNLSMVGN
jgi:hypothetical protein